MILSFLAGLKPKLWALGAAILAFVAVIVRLKVVTYQRDKFQYRAKVATAGLERRAETEEREAEINQEWSDYEREAKADIDCVPDILSKPRDR